MASRIIAACLLALMWSMGQAQVLEWTRETGTSGSDYGYGIAVDSSGNAYVTGTSQASLNGQPHAGNADIVVLKYNSSGGLEWTRETGTSGNDYANGIAVDSSGNAFVTGNCQASLNGQPFAGGNDVVVLKYNSSGGLEWTRQTGTTGSDYAYGIAVDTEGSAYLAGFSDASLNGQPHAGGDDIVVLKYNTSGGLEWTRETGSGTEDKANGIAVDSSGNVYVTGHSRASLNGQPFAGENDIVVLKYSNSGGLEWTREAGTSGNEVAYSIAVDSSGNVYVAGRSDASLNGQPHAGQFDIVVLKYDTSGGLEWTRETGSSGLDYAEGITVDSSGNAYVTGYSTASLNGQPFAGGFDIVVLKYNASNGTLQWTRETGSSGNDRGKAAATDARGMLLYVAGDSAGSLNGQTFAGSTDIVVLTYLCGCVGGYSNNGLPPCVDCPAGQWSTLGGATSSTVCQPCSSGQWSTAGSSTCESCAPGTYASTVREAASLCTPCGAGRWSSVLGASNSTVCIDCVAGSWCSAPIAASSTDCTACGTGRYSTIVAASSSTQCPLCAAGTWNSLDTVSACIDCSAGRYSTTVGATADTVCDTCIAGYFSSLAGAPSDTACTKCPRGTFGTAMGLSDASLCTACPRGTYNPNEGANDASYCESCLPGFFASTTGNSACEPCAPGTVMPGENATACADCSPGHYVSVTGQTTCSLCAVDTWASAVGVSQCTDCPTGMATGALTGATQVTDCYCLAGSYGPAGGGSCTACPAGQYSSTASATASTACISCAAGQYATQGSSQCTDCSAGTFSSVPLTDVSLCTACGAGRWSSVPGRSSACDSCPAGSWSSLSQASSLSECTACGAGSFGTLPGSTATTACTLCPAGSWSSAAIASVCSGCPAGTYGSTLGETGAGSCFACPLGQWSSDVAASSLSTCTSCPPGTYSTTAGATASSECTACAPGEASADAGAHEASKCQSCLPGHYASTTGLSACALCALGTASSQLGATTCDDCNAGSYAAAPGQSACLVCGAGYRSPNTSVCLVCDVGTSSPAARSSACTPCTAGTYASAAAATVCSRCPLDHYNDANRSSRCTSCPDNTTTAHAADPDSLRSCTCVPSMFGPAGGPCSTCPLGAECVGGVENPTAAKGYYGVWAGPSSVFLECSPPEACLGGSTSACDTGYRGIMCAECDDQYYRLEQRCAACPDAPGWRIVLFVFVALALALFLVWAAGSYGSYFSSFSILFSYLQVLAILAELKVAWPVLLRDTFESMSILNFNTDLLATECSFQVTYEDKWTLMILLPFIFLGMFILIFGLFEALGHRSKKNKSPNEMPADQPAAAGASAVAVARRRMTHVVRHVMTTGEILPVDRFTFLDLLLNAFVMLLSFCYIFVVSKTTELFDCTQQGNGRSTLDASPTLDCGQEWWWNLFPFALIMLLLYGAGFPLAFLFIRRQKTTLSKDMFLQRYSLLTSRYRDEFWWWELVVLARKLGIVLMKTFFTNYPTFQMLLATLILVVMFLLQQKLEPYAQNRHNRLEFVLLICSYLVMFSGLLFNSPDVTAVAARTTAAGIVVFLVVLLSTLAMAGAVVGDVVMQVAQKRQWSESSTGVAGWAMRVPWLRPPEVPRRGTDVKLQAVGVSSAAPAAEAGPDSASRAGAVAVAAHDFAEEGDRYLTFRSGERIAITEADSGSGWCKGRIGDREGYFPANRVDAVDDGARL